MEALMGAFEGPFKAVVQKTALLQLLLSHTAKLRVALYSLSAIFSKNIVQNQSFSAGFLNSVCHTVCRWFCHALCVTKELQAQHSRGLTELEHVPSG